MLSSYLVQHCFLERTRDEGANRNLSVNQKRKPSDFSWPVWSLVTTEILNWRKGVESWAIISGGDKATRFSSILICPGSSPEETCFSFVLSEASSQCLLFWVANLIKLSKGDLCYLYLGELRVLIQAQHNLDVHGFPQAWRLLFWYHIRSCCKCLVAGALSSHKVRTHLSHGALAWVTVFPAWGQPTGMSWWHDTWVE